MLALQPEPWPYRLHKTDLDSSRHVGQVDSGDVTKFDVRIWFKYDFLFLAVPEQLVDQELDLLSCCVLDELGPVARIAWNRWSQNEAPSDVNKLLDCCSYPGWKMTNTAYRQKYLASTICNRLSPGTSGTTLNWWSLNQLDYFLVVLVAHGCKWSSCTPAQLDLQALGDVTCDHMSCLSDNSKVPQVIASRVQTQSNWSERCKSEQGSQCPGKKTWFGKSWVQILVPAKYFFSQNLRKSVLEQ